MADEGEGPVDQPLGQAAAVHDLAREDEEGDGDEHVFVDAADDLQGQDGAVDHAVAHEDREIGGGDHAEAHVEADDEQHEEQGDDSAAHDLAPLAGGRKEPTMRETRTTTVSAMPILRPR